MKITVIGRGRVGGGLARRWEAAGHDVTALGRGGGDASGSDAVLVAVPSNAIDDALASVTGVEGTVALDATNAFAGRAEGFESLAHQVKARTNGPVTKAFNINFASIYDRIEGQRARPSQLYCGDDEAREASETLIRDAGYDPVRAGGLENARVLEDFLQPLVGITESLGGPAFYRFAPPGEL
jgi:predicted dinucleotide-binding enzyme